MSRLKLEALRLELQPYVSQLNTTESTTGGVISDYPYATAAMEDKYSYLDGEMDEDGNYSSDAEQLWADYTEETVRQYLEENTMLISRHKDDDDNDVWLFRSF